MIIFSDWIQVTKNLIIDHNLETAPLQIMTNTKLGVPDYVHLQVNYVGRMRIEFRNSRFWIENCGNHLFPSNLPTEQNKQWTISKTKEALTILCNNVEVLNLVYSSLSNFTRCNEWSGASTSLKFVSNDLASDYYRNPFGQGKKYSFPWFELALKLFIYSLSCLTVTI